MALRKVYFGSFGPFLYDDTDPINDPDGDFAGEDHQAMTTDGQMRVEQGPVANEEVIRLIDLGFRLLPPVSVVDIDNPTELNALAGDLGALVLAYQIIGATGLNKYTTYAYDTSGPAVDAPNVVDAAGAGDERWIALGMKGPASALDNEVPVFDGTTGKKIKAETDVFAGNGQLKLKDATTYLSRDASNNMTFTDAVTGTRTLKNIGCPVYLFIKATGQIEGDLHLLQVDWEVSKALIGVISIVTSSTDWDLYILQNDNGYAADDANIPKLQIMEAGNGNANIFVSLPYEDEDASNEVHLYYLDNSGANTADIYIRGTELI